jgi:Spy/CpxP family protein refolding chaperone
MMNKVSRNPIAGILAGAAMLALLGTMTLPAQSTDAKAKAAEAQPRPRAARLADRLGISPEQRKKIEEFRAARLKERQAFRTEMDKMRQEFRALREDPKADPAKVNGLIDRMYRLRADRTKEALRDRSSLRGILTPEQLGKIRGLRGMAGERMGRMGLAGRGRLGRLAERWARRHPRLWHRWQTRRLDRKF